MDEESFESYPPGKVKEILSDAPYLVRSLGYAANNTGIFDEFCQLYDEGREFKHMKDALVGEFKARGIEDVDDFLSLYGIPNEFDD